jgi:hypothetical protein
MIVNPKILVLVVFLFSYGQLFAQDNSEFFYKRFGVIIGANLSNMNFNKGNPAPPVPVKASWKSGITVGFLVHIPLAENLFLQPEYLFTQRSGSDKSIGVDYLTSYLSLPVLLNYRISSRFALLAGPQAELLINTKEKKNDLNSNITHDMEERSIGVTAGVNVHLYKSLSLSARYLQGLNHIGIGQRSEVKEFKYQAVNLSLEIGL